MRNLFGKMLVFFVIICILSLTMSALCLAADDKSKDDAGGGEDYSSEVSALPWQKPLGVIEAALTGPVAKAVSTIAIVIAGLGMSFGEGQQRKMFKVVFGIAIAMGAGVLISNMFGGAGGLGF